MRWLPLILVLLSISASAQRPNEILLIVREAAEFADAYDYMDPEFKWDMDGRVQLELNEGINYLKEGKLTIAVAKLDAAIKLDAKLWVAFYYKGVCLKLMRTYGGAAYSFITAEMLHPRDFATSIEIGKSYALLKNYDDAKIFFKKASSLRPTSGLPSYLLGNLALDQGNIPGAKQQYENALKTEPAMLNAEVKLGILRAFETNNREEVVSIFANVLKKDSLHQKALLYHAMATAETEKKASLKDWERLARLNPTNVFYRMMLGSLKTDEGRYDEAFSDLRRVIALAQLDDNTFVGRQTKYDKAIDVTNAGHYVVTKVYGFSDTDAAEIKKAYCLLFVGKHDESLLALLKVTDFESPLIFYLKAIANEHKGDHPSAFNDYNSALVRDNDIIDAHKKKGIYLTEMKQWLRAEKAFNEMLRLNNEAFVAYRFRGVVRYQVERYQEAITDFTTYLARDSTNKDVLGYRGMAYQRNNQFFPSVLDFLKSEHFDAIPPFTVISGELDKLVDSGDTTEAILWLGRFTTAVPMYIHAQKYYLQMLMSMNRWDDVGKQADKALLRTAETRGKQTGTGYTNEDLSYLLSIKGTSLVYQGRPAEAVRELSLAIEKDKNNGLAYLSRAKAYLQQNNKDDAAVDLKRAKKLGQAEASAVLKDM